MPSIEERAGDGGDNNENGREDAEYDGYRYTRIAVVVECTSVDGCCHTGRKKGKTGLL